MSRASKRVLVFIAALVFCVLAPVLIFFAMGYQWQAQGRLEQTGGLIIYTLPVKSSIQVLLNNQVVATTTGHTFLGGLQPGFYTVTASAPGFKTWSKSLIISPSRVTKFENVILAAQQPMVQPLIPLSRVKQLTLAPDGHHGLATTDQDHIYVFDTQEQRATRLSLNLGPAPTLNSLVWLDDYTIVFSRQNKLVKATLTNPTVEIIYDYGLTAPAARDGLLYAIQVNTRSIVLVTNDGHVTSLFRALPSDIDLAKVSLAVISPKQFILLSKGLAYSLDLDTESLTELGPSQSLPSLSPDSQQLLSLNGPVVSLYAWPTAEAPQLPKLLTLAASGDRLFWSATTDYFYWTLRDTLYLNESPASEEPLTTEIPIKISFPTLVGKLKILGIVDGRISQVLIAQNTL